MIKAILTLTALNLVLMPLTFLVHVNAIDMRDCSITAYLSGGSILGKFAECTAPKARVVFYETPSAPERQLVERHLQSSLVLGSRVMPPN